MKIVLVMILMVTFSAQARVFECRDGDEVDTLVLEKHQAVIRDITLINMLRVDWDNRLRSFSLIGDPWFDLEVDTEMLKGKHGYAYLKSFELQRGQIVFSKFYECIPRSH